MIAILFLIILSSVCSIEFGWQNVTYHLLGIPYSEANGLFSMCAFTSKVVRWCRMLNELGVNYIVYANANTDPSCRTVVEIFSADERLKYYGSDAAWREQGGYFNQRIDSPGAIEWIRRTSAEVSVRKRAHDIVLVTLGVMHSAIAHNNGLPGVEVGVGYRETFSFYRVFESYTWLAATTISKLPDVVESVSHYDAVVPMCYFMDEFETIESPIDYSCDDTIALDTRPYIAYVGRIATSKGFRIVMEILCHSPELRLKVAGTGDLQSLLTDFRNCSDRVDYVGVLGPEKRNSLVRGAIALVAPSMYVEPFGSIIVESMFLGTPVITTDHAAMTETVWHGVSGFRCRTLSCFLRATRQATSLDRARIIRYASANYLCSSVVWRYVEYFQDVVNLQHGGRGWYSVASNEKPLTQIRFFPD